MNNSNLLLFVLLIYIVVLVIFYSINSKSIYDNFTIYAPFRSDYTIIDGRPYIKTKIRRRYDKPCDFAIYGDRIIERREIPRDFISVDDLGNKLENPVYTCEFDGDNHYLFTTGTGFVSVPDYLSSPEFYNEDFYTIPYSRSMFSRSRFSRSPSGHMNPAFARQW